MVFSKICSYMSIHFLNNQKGKRGIPNVSKALEISFDESSILLAEVSLRDIRYTLNIMHAERFC